MKAFLLVVLLFFGQVFNTGAKDVASSSPDLIKLVEAPILKGTLRINEIDEEGGGASSDPENYRKEINDFLNKEAIINLKNIASQYAKGVENIVKEVESMEKRNITQVVAQGQKLGKLTNAILEAITGIEKGIEEYGKIMGEQDIKIREIYTKEMEALERLSRGKHWDYSGRARYIWEP